MIAGFMDGEWIEVNLDGLDSMSDRGRRGM
jgi:hypothetical protein